MSYFLLTLLYLLLSINQQLFNTDHPLVDKACEQALNKSLFTNRTIKRIIRASAFEVIEVSSSKDIVGIRGKNNCFLVITGNIDLDNKSFSIPSNSILYFNGGSFQNGRLIGNHTRIISSNKLIFNPGVSSYHGYEMDGKYSYVAKHDKSVILSGTWSNKSVGNRWTGIESGETTRCQALAINNHITLHALGSKVSFDKGTYFIYDKVRSLGREIDFSFSELASINFMYVENSDIPLPDKSVEVSLKSVYGLLDVNDEVARVSNVVINGRASTRSEEPILGSECLLSITKCKSGSLNNIKLIDAVDCAICTSDIENVTFNNLHIDGCGEHGFYTHAYNGTLIFNNCSFLNCGNNRNLYNVAGCSSCVKAAGARTRTPNELKDFKIIFNSCTFYSDHGVPVVTTYGDIPIAEYNHCKWHGVNGYVTMNDSFVKQTGRPYEYTFSYCNNPCGSYNSSNVIRKLFYCINVKSPFDDTMIVEGCKVECGYNESRNRHSKVLARLFNEPLLIRNTVFTKGEEDASIRNIVYNCRPLVFENCQWNFKHALTSNHRGLYCIELRNDDGSVAGTSYISFSNCSFAIDQYRLLLCKNTHIDFWGGEVKKTYGSFLKEIDKSNIIKASKLLDKSTGQLLNK